MAHSLTEDQKQAWIAFILAQGVLTKKIDRVMQEQGVVSMDVYDVLLALEEAPDRRLRMSELADAILLTRSGLTRLVDRLEAEGLIERLACPNDRRALHAHLTAKGLAERERAWPVYRAAIGEHFGVHMSDEEARTLRDVLSRMVDPALLELSGLPPVSA